MDIVFNGTRYKCIEYAKSKNILEEAKGWKNFGDGELIDDATYLVCWKSVDGMNMSPIRAYWDEGEQAFFPLDSYFAFPLKVDIYFKIPDRPKRV